MRKLSLSLIAAAAVALALAGCGSGSLDGSAAGTDARTWRGALTWPVSGSVTVSQADVRPLSAGSGMGSVVAWAVRDSDGTYHAALPADAAVVVEASGKTAAGASVRLAAIVGTGVGRGRADVLLDLTGATTIAADAITALVRAGTAAGALTPAIVSNLETAAAASVAGTDFTDAAQVAAAAQAALTATNNGANAPSGSGTTALAITPSTVSMAAGASQAFTANAPVMWAVQEGAAGGSIGSSTGVYTAPATAGTYHVLAASIADPSVIAGATVTVVAGGSGYAGSYYATYTGAAGSLITAGSASFTVDAAGAITGTLYTRELGNVAITTGSVSSDGTIVIQHKTAAGAADLTLKGAAGADGAFHGSGGYQESFLSTGSTLYTLTWSAQKN